MPRARRADGVVGLVERRDRANALSISDMRVGMHVAVGPRRRQEHVDARPAERLARHDLHVLHEVLLVPDGLDAEQPEDLAFHHAVVRVGRAGVQRARDLLRRMAVLLLVVRDRRVDELLRELERRAARQLLGVHLVEVPAAGRRGRVPHRARRRARARRTGRSARPSGRRAPRARGRTARRGRARARGSRASGFGTPSSTRAPAAVERLGGLEAAPDHEPDDLLARLARRARSPRRRRARRASRAEGPRRARRGTSAGGRS